MFGINSIAFGVSLIVHYRLHISSVYQHMEDQFS